MMQNWRRKSKSLFALTILMAMLAGCGAQSKDASVVTPGTDAKLPTIKIGYQKFNTINILKARGTLEIRLKEAGYGVEWLPFPGGNQLIEAMVAGSIDFGHASDGSGVLAQAGNKPVKYIAAESPYPRGVAILVPKDSPIQDVKQLKGKKVAVTKGGNQQYLLIKALEKNGLKYEDIEPLYYKDASEGRVAFESGKIDALGFWEPFYAVLEQAGNSKVLVDGEGITENRTYYFSTEKFSKEKPELVKLILEELEKSNQWANKHPADVAKLLAPELQIDEASLKLATERRTYGVQKIDDLVIKGQQELADTFYQIKLIPAPIKVQDAIDSNPNWLPDGLK